MQSIKTEIKWAVIFMAMQLAWMLFEKMAGLHDKHIESHAWVTNLVAIPSILIYVLALREKKNQDYGGSITYKQAFTSGLIMTAFITLLAPISQYITSAFISPDYFTNMIAHTVQKGMMKQAEAEQYFNLKSYLIQVLMFTPVMGLITTAVVSLFIRSKK